MAEQVPLGRMIGYCGHLGKLYLDTRLREQYNVTAPQSYTLLYLAKSVKAGRSCSGTWNGSCI